MDYAREITALIENGFVKPVIQKCYSFDEYALAQKNVGHGIGRNLVIIDSELK